MKQDRAFISAKFSDVPAGSLILMKSARHSELCLRLDQSYALVLAGDFAVASFEDQTVAVLQGATLKYSHLDIDELYSNGPRARPGCLLVTSSSVLIGVEYGSITNRFWVDTTTGAIQKAGDVLGPAATVASWKIVRAAEPLDEELLLQHPLAEGEK